MAANHLPNTLALEGIDGCGKTTTAETIKHRLCEVGQTALRHTLFYNDPDEPFWVAYRAMFHDDAGEPIESYPPNDLQPFHAFNMVRMFVEKESEIRQGCVSIFDRFLLSRIALIRSQADGNPHTTAERGLLRAVQNGILKIPEFSFVLDIDPVIARERIEREVALAKRTFEPKESLDELKKAAVSIRDVADEYRGLIPNDLLTIHIGDTIDDVAERILAKVRPSA